MASKTAPRTCFELSGGEEGCRNRDVLDHGYCHACQTYLCCMPECTEAVATPATRCEFCHPLGCPCANCRDCACSDCVAAGLAPAEAVPEEVEDETVRMAYEPIGAEGLGDVRSRRAEALRAQAA